MPAAKSAAKSATKSVTPAAPAKKRGVRKTSGASAKVEASVVAAVPAPAVVVSAPKDEVRKPAKPRLVRDSFTMPQADFDLVAVLKQRALGFQRPAKKSELLRAGLHVLAGLDDARLRAALEALQPLKPGRPKKGA